MIKKKIMFIIKIVYPFTQIFIISHKGTVFSQNKNSVSRFQDLFENTQTHIQV
jgi:hypothetical protein